MTIETDRLILREWQISDIEDLLEGLNDFDTAKNLTVPFPYTENDAKDFLTNHVKYKGNEFYFAIELKENKKVIGSTNVTFFDGKVKGGIWLNKNFQGLGYGTEAFRARAKFAFDTFGVEELENGYFEFNERSGAMQKKLGYEIVGRKMNRSSALNKDVVEIVTKLTKQNFIKNNSNELDNCKIKNS